MVAAVRQNARKDRLTTQPRGAWTYGLTPRENEILRPLILHHSYREIADVLCISPRTVGTRITSINNKLGVTSRREAAYIAAKSGSG